MSVQPSSQWASGDAYQRYMGRWSLLLADRFLKWLSAEPGGRWLDVGSGAGALTAAILARADPASVFGIDQSEPFVAYARSKTRDERASFEVANAMAIPAGDAVFDNAVSGLCLNFVPQPQSAVAEMIRLTRPGGIVGCYVWDYAGGMQMVRYFWDAAAKIDPDLSVDEAHQSPICAPEPLRTLFEGAALADVETTSLVIEMRFADFDDYWGPFGDGTGPAPAYLKTLSPDARHALEQELRRRLPSATDGSIAMTAKAWAAKGNVP